MVGFLNLRWIPDVPLKLLLPFLHSLISKRGTSGLVEAAGWGGICVCVCVLVACTCGHLREEVRKWKPCRWKGAPRSTSQAHFSNMNQRFWVKSHPMKLTLTSCCFCAVSARGSWHGRSWRNNAAFPRLPIVHRSLHCSVPPRPLHHSHPASWHGDGSAVDKVHNTPSSPHHNRGTWTQAPLWHTRGWGGDTGASQAGGAANVSVTCW